MSTPVLVAIILLAVGCAATLTRLRLADRRSVAAHHRALETMGRLVAQHPVGETAVTPEAPAGQAHVRLVETADPALPPPLPRVSPLRTRPRTHSRQPTEYRSWDDVAPAANEFYADEPVAPPSAEPVLSRPMLHFDALAPPPPRSPAEEDPAGSDRELGPVGAPSQGRRLRTRRLRTPRLRTRRLRTRRPRRRWGQARPALRFAVVGILVVVVAAGGTVGVLTLRADRGRASPPSHPPPQAASPPASAPASAPVTTPAPHPAPVLVTTSAGYSEYRLSGPATILLTASGTCWVQIRQAGPTGTVLYQGDLYAGQTHPANGPIWLRLGNPTKVTITVNGVALSPPSLVAGEPYNLQFD
jgi:hypothetical protein